MSTMIEVNADGNPIAYAWPGGYPIYYLSRQGFRDDETNVLEFNQYDRTESVTCAKCAAKVKDPDNDLILTACDINYEDTDLYCDVCSESIESAYGEDETEKTEETEDEE